MQDTRPHKHSAHARLDGVSGAALLVTSPSWRQIELSALNLRPEVRLAFEATSRVRLAGRSTKTKGGAAQIIACAKGVDVINEILTHLAVKATLPEATRCLRRRVAPRMSRTVRSVVAGFPFDFCLIVSPPGFTMDLPPMFNQSFQSNWG